MSFHIAICDDDSYQREIVSNFIVSYMKQKGMMYHITMFSSGEELLKHNEIYDILILDVEMGKMSGIEVKDILFEKRNTSNIIFLTNYDEYITYAFGKNVHAYVNKQNLTGLIYYLDKIVQEYLERDVYIINKYVFLSTEIILIESNGSYCDVYKTNGKVETLRIYLKEIEDILHTCDFLQRIHRSYIVNYNFIKVWNHAVVEVEMPNKETKNIFINKRKEKELKNKYLSYIKGKLIHV